MAPRTTARGPLTRDEIVRAALDLAESKGLEKLSLHKIAEAVGVKTMSLYNHIADKSDVLDAMADQILAEMDIPDLDAMDWQDGLLALSKAFRETALHYPHSAALVLTRRLNAPAVLPLVESALKLGRRAGLETAEAVHVCRAYIAFLVGSLLREVGTTSNAAGIRPSIVASSETELIDAGLEAVAEAADELAICDHDYEFEFGLHLLLESVHRLSNAR